MNTGNARRVRDAVADDVIEWTSSDKVFKEILARFDFKSCGKTNFSTRRFYQYSIGNYKLIIERFHSRDYRPYWFTETKESIYIKVEFNSQRFSLGHQHGRHFFVLGHQHGRRDVM